MFKQDFDLQKKQCEKGTLMTSFRNCTVIGAKNLHTEPKFV